MFAIRTLISYLAAFFFFFNWHQIFWLCAWVHYWLIHLMNLQYICVYMFAYVWVRVCHRGHTVVVSLKMCVCVCVCMYDVTVIKCENHIKSHTAHYLCRLALTSWEWTTQTQGHTCMSKHTDAFRHAALRRL